MSAEAEHRVDAALAPHREAGIPCLRVSALRGEGLAALARELAQRTAVLIGPRGVGKSSLANALDGRRQRDTASVRRKDDKGRHTTTASELAFLSDGTRLIDTPGVRAFGTLPVDAQQIEAAFPEIAEAAFFCRFRNCRHDREPDCAVRDALANG